MLISSYIFWINSYNQRVAGDKIDYLVCKEEKTFINLQQYVIQKSVKNTVTKKWDFVYISIMLNPNPNAT